MYKHPFYRVHTIVGIPSPHGYISPLVSGDCRKSKNENSKPKPDPNDRWGQLTDLVCCAVAEWSGGGEVVYLPALALPLLIFSSRLVHLSPSSCATRNQEFQERCVTMHRQDRSRRIKAKGLREIPYARACGSPPSVGDLSPRRNSLSIISNTRLSGGS